MLILAPPISESKCPLFTNLKNCGQNIVKMTKDYENDNLKISCFPGREGKKMSVNEIPTWQIAN